MLKFVQNAFFPLLEQTLQSAGLGQKFIPAVGFIQNTLK